MTQPHPTIPSNTQSLALLLKDLKLSHMLSSLDEFERKAVQQHWSHTQFLLELCQYESSQRYHSRIQRALQEAHLPVGKAISNFDFSRYPQLPQAALVELAQDSGWLKRAENLLLFGPSGVGKTHLAAAIGLSLVERGRKVRFITGTALVQQLQRAKLELQLQTVLQKLDRYDLLVIDDIGYVKKTESETSVLFELIAHRYEFKSLLITANQPFSSWDTIFADPIMTVAAVDRLVHHAVIVDIQGESFRQQAALQKQKSAGTSKRTK